MNQWIQRILESGLQFKFLEDASTGLPKFTIPNVQETNTAINLQHVFVTFIILIIGHSAASLSFILEILRNKIIE